MYLYTFVCVFDIYIYIYIYIYILSWLKKTWGVFELSFLFLCFWCVFHNSSCVFGRKPPEAAGHRNPGALSSQAIPSEVTAKMRPRNMCVFFWPTHTWPEFVEVANHIVCSNTKLSIFAIRHRRGRDKSLRRFWTLSTMMIIISSVRSIQIRIDIDDVNATSARNRNWSWGAARMCKCNLMNCQIRRARSDTRREAPLEEKRTQR